MVDPIILFGLQDQQLRILEETFQETNINARGERIKLSGPAEEVMVLKEVIVGMIEIVSRIHNLTN